MLKKFTTVNENVVENVFGYKTGPKIEYDQDHHFPLVLSRDPYSVKSPK